jgi:ribosome-associated translation inhibitor RaiA
MPLFALANEPKRFIRVEGGGHSDLDRFGALDIALDKLTERLRRSRDRRKDHRHASASPPA